MFTKFVNSRTLAGLEKWLCKRVDPDVVARLPPAEGMPRSPRFAGSPFSTQQLPTKSAGHPQGIKKICGRTSASLTARSNPWIPF